MFARNLPGLPQLEAMNSYDCGLHYLRGVRALIFMVTFPQAQQCLKNLSLVIGYLSFVIFCGIRRFERQMPNWFSLNPSAPLTKSPISPLREDLIDIQKQLFFSFKKKMPKFDPLP
jgi:hypothetical protein